MSIPNVPTVRCRECGVLISKTDGICDKCGAAIDNPYATPVTDIVDHDAGSKVKPDLGMRILMPVGRSGYAIASGYFGLISVLILPGPLALLFGILAIRDIKRHSHKTGMGRAIFGIVFGGVATLVLGLIVVMQITKGR
ncbi:MAG: DUF4190 domain-containing protein [Pirellulales bacterium]|nr:DUF4190 domain-containing protein [Pirellulales bacterium]